MLNDISSFTISFVLVFIYTYRSHNILTRYHHGYYTTGHRGQLNTGYHLTTYPSSPQSIYDMTIDYNKTNEHLQTTNQHKKKITNCFTQIIHKRCQTHKTNRSMNRETIQSYSITLTTTQVQETIKQSKNNSQGTDKINHRYLLDSQFSRACLKLLLEKHNTTHMEVG